MSIQQPARQAHRLALRRPRNGWRTGARVRFDCLAQDAAALPSGDGDLRRTIEQLGQEIEQRSSQVDRVWPKLHRLEEQIAARARGQLLIDYAAWTMEHAKYPGLEDDKSLGDPWVRVSVAAQKGRAAGPEQDLARDIATLMRHVHAIVDQQHLAANESRRRLLTAGYAAAAVSALIVLAAIFLKSMPFLVGAENFPGVPSWQVVILVALGGVVGGCWGAFPAFTSATRDRFRLQYARAFTRLAMGVLSALIGVSLMGAGWVANLTGSAAPSLFAVAVAFGLAQEPITKILEKKAGHVPSEPSDTAEESYTASRSGVIREVGARTGAQRGNGQLVKPGYEGPDSRRTS